MYAITIANSLESNIPSVVVFASPAFCTNAVCGPQVEVLQELKNLYIGTANFIHVDFYENPQEIQGDINNAILSTTVLEWSLPSIEWTFVINRSGIIEARFEGFATVEEILKVLVNLF